MRRGFYLSCGVRVPLPTRFVLSLLLKKGAYVDDGELCTPLMIAVIHGRVAVVPMLLKNLAHLETVSEGGDTLLMVAAGYGWAEIVKVLLLSGVNVDPSGPMKKDTPLILASRFREVGDWHGPRCRGQNFARASGTS